MSTPIMLRADGLCTVYAMSCGYQDQCENVHRIQATRWMDHGVYHVRVHDFGTAYDYTVSPPAYVEGGRLGEGRILWESFDSAASSIALYKRIRKAIRALDEMGADALDKDVSVIQSVIDQAAA